MRRFALLWVFLLLFVAVAIYLPGFSKYLKLKHTESDLHEEIERLRIQITQLEKEEHLLKTDLTGLEQAVREELGLVKPGEIVVKAVEEEVPQSSAVPAKPSSKTVH